MVQLECHQDRNNFSKSFEVFPGVRRFSFSRKLTENFVFQLHLGEALPPAFEICKDVGFYSLHAAKTACNISVASIMVT